MRPKWLACLYSIRSRCTNKLQYSFEWYGAKGIKCLLTKDDIRYLWIMDQADFMRKPSIDRLDSNDNYTISNCRFIEMSKNLNRRKNESRNDKRAGIKSCCVVLLHDMDFYKNAIDKIAPQQTRNKNRLRYPELFSSVN